MPLTRQEFVDAHRHEFAGYVADAAVTKATGAPLACLLRHLMKRIDERLSYIYDQFTAKPVANGQPEGKRR